MRRVLETIIGIALFVVVLRTWFLLGLVVPIEVSAGSMAPTLAGPHYMARCPACQLEFAVGREHVPFGQVVACPNCQRDVDLARAVLRRGDWLWIDRLTPAFRPWRRWEVVVFRCPNDAKTYCVKRIVGLPGERVALREGDVFLDGQRAVKPLTAQRRLRILIHREREPAPRWRGLTASAPWRCTGNQWHCPKTPTEAVLQYTHPRGEPVTDALAYNADGGRGHNPAADLMITALVQWSGDGELVVSIPTTGQPVEARIRPSDDELSLRQGDRLLRSWDRRAGVRLVDRSESLVEFSLFDRRAVLAIDGVVWSAAIVAPGHLDRDGPSEEGRLAVSSRDLNVILTDLTLWRDVHYTVADGHEPTWQLGPSEFFLLGDNARISHDSRTWRQGPGLDAKFLLGRLLHIP